MFDVCCAMSIVGCLLCVWKMVAVRCVLLVGYYFGACCLLIAACWLVFVVWSLLLRAVVC